MNPLKKTILALSLICFNVVLSFAQATTSNPDFMRSIGKIYVVVGVLAMVFVGIIVFLILLERKIARLEREN